MKLAIIPLLLLVIATSTYSQTLGGPCEGCEALLEYRDKKLISVDTLPDFESNEPKMVIRGTVYKADGETPASGIIIYAYHTNRDGIYPTKGDEQGWAKRHGYLRGWTQTNKNGHYVFYTFKPETYPSRTEPGHVHLTIKEPGKQEYWIDSIHFEDDVLLTERVKKNLRNRGGSGVVTLKTEGSHLLAKRDIILGLNIPNYR